MAGSLCEAVKPFGADAYEDDSGDVESVYSLTKLAAEKAHRDRRPAFLNIKCCRYLEHVGIGTDWNWGYRDQAAVEREWISRDAVKMQRARLASHQVSESAIAAIEEEIVAELFGCARVGRSGGAVVKAQHAFAAAIRYLEQHGVIATAQIARLEDVEVSGKFDEATFVAWSLVDVRNDAVGGVFGIDGEISFAD